jgi:hypothetical protein
MTVCTCGPGAVVVLVDATAVVVVADGSDAVVRVVLVVAVTVVVVVPAHAPAGQASQQLATSRGHALPPFGAWQRAAGPIVHLVFPRGFVRQQATAPGSPQVERAAQASVARRHVRGRPPSATAARTTFATQRT